MTRILSRLRLGLAMVAATVGASAISCGVGTAGAVPTSGGTALPAGWELCVLQGVGAPATPANVADLDEWQVAEGGSTNNSAAYNPFNTRRTTDVNGAPLAAVLSQNGFPAFSDWLSGCAATVATLLQSNMSQIVAALKAGDVAPPTAFLAAVDQTQWCAPSNGVPCYESTIEGAPGSQDGQEASASLSVPVLALSSALEVLGNVRADLGSYEQTVATAATARTALAGRDEQLAAAQSGISIAQSKFAAAKGSLRRFAINQYISGALFAANSFLNGSKTPGPFGPPDANGVVAHEYQSIVAAELVIRYKAAAASVGNSHSQRDAASQALAQATAVLASDETNQNRSLARLLTDLASLQKAGACTTVTITTAVPAGSQSGASSPAGPSSTAPANAAVPSTPTTTTTTVPSTTAPLTTTTTVPPATSTTVPVTTAPTTTTTTTSTTVPDTAAPTTTTTVPTTSGATSGAVLTQAVQTVSASGLSTLQTCTAALTASGSQ